MAGNEIMRKVTVLKSDNLASPYFELTKETLKKGSKGNGPRTAGDKSEREENLFLVLPVL